MQHICVVKSGTQYTTYLNATATEDGAGHPNPITVDEPLILSGDLTINASGYPIPKMLIYNRVLTTDEITQNHNSIVAEVGE